MKPGISLFAKMKFCLSVCTLYCPLEVKNLNLEVNILNGSEQGCFIQRLIKMLVDLVIFGLAQQINEHWQAVISLLTSCYCMISEFCSPNNFHTVTSQVAYSAALRL